MTIVQIAAVLGLVAAGQCGATEQDVSPDATQPIWTDPVGLVWTQVKPDWRGRDDCGPMALYVFMRLHDRDVGMNDVLESFSLKPGVGSSLADISRAASALGLPTSMRFINARDLKNLRMPCIVHSNGSLKTNVGHFTVIVDYDPLEKRFGVIHTDLQDFQWVEEGRVLQRVSGYVIVHDGGLLPGAIGRLEWVAIGVTIIAGIGLGITYYYLRTRLSCRRITS